MPHPNFSDEVNRNIAQSEIEGGVYLEGLCEGAVLEVETQHHAYTIVIRGRGRDLISGHPKYCPDPVPVRIAGSTWGGSMLKLRFIGRGMHLEFWHPVFRTIKTSRIVDIRASEQLASAAGAARKLTERHMLVGLPAARELPAARSPASFGFPFSCVRLRFDPVPHIRNCGIDWHTWPQGRTVLPTTSVRLSL